MDRQALRGPFHGALKGIGFIVGNRDYLRVQLLFSTFNLFNGLGAAVLIAYVLARSGESPAALAAVNTASVVGTLLGGAAVAAIGSSISRHRLIGGSLLAAGLVGRSLLGSTDNIALWGAASLVRGMGVQGSNAPLLAIWQEHVPRERQGRVFGARRLLGQGPYPIAVAAGGLLADHVFGDDGSVASAVLGVLDRAGLKWGGVGVGMGIMLTAIGICEAVVGAALLRSGSLRRMDRSGDSMAAPDNDPD
ncbi:MAG: hypothetical protein ACRCYQ_09540 [Nocardioides sp.]